MHQMSAPLKSPFCSVALSGLFCNSLIVKKGLHPSLWSFRPFGTFFKSALWESGSSLLTYFGSLGVYEFGSLDDTSCRARLTYHFSLVTFHLSARSDFPLGRICNPTAISMSICNAERKRITNPYTRCCRISNPAERSLGVWTILLTTHFSLLTYHLSLFTKHPPRGLGGLPTSQFSVLSLSPWAHKHPPRGLGGLLYILAFCFSPAPEPRYFERASLNFHVTSSTKVRRAGLWTVRSR